MPTHLVQNVSLHLTEEKLDLQTVTDQVITETAGGTCVFVGTVRNITRGKAVVALEFEAYVPMAIAEMRKIADAVTTRWPVLKVAIHHRIGYLEIGEVPVIIAVSAGHRQAAFEACQYCIDTLKETVPIWKKEIFQDGEVWVSAHP